MKPWEMNWQAPSPDDAAPKPWQRNWGATPEAKPAPQPDPGATPDVPLAGMGDDGGNLNWNDPGYTTATEGTGPVEPERDFTRPLMVGVQGAGRGLANLAGLPVDLAAAGTNAALWAAENGINLFLDDENEISLPRADRPIGGSDMIADTASTVAENMGVPLVDPATMNTRERLGYNINQLGTEALAFSAGPARLAARTSIGRPGSTPSAADPLVRPYREAPGKTAAEDLGASVAAGSALTGAQSLPEDGPIPRTVAEFMATLFGGITGASAVDMGQRVATSGGRAATLRGSGSIDPTIPLDERGMPTQRGVANKAAARLKGDMSDEQAATVANTISDSVAELWAAGLPSPTAGALAGDPQMAQMEVAARTRNPTPFMRRDEAVKSAATERLGSIGENADPETARAYAREVDAGRRTAADAAVEPFVEAAGRAQDDVAAAQQDAQAYGRERRPANVVGQQQESSAAFFRNATEETLDPMTQEKNTRFDAPQVEIDATPLTDLAQRVEDGLSVLRSENYQAPVDVTARIKRLLPQEETVDTGLLDAEGAPVLRTQSTGGTVQWQELSKLRRDLSAAQVKARQADSYELADTIGDLKTGIDAEADKLARSGSEAGEQIAEAQRYYREVYAPVWAQPNSPNRNLRDQIQQGSRPEPERALELYGLTGKPTPRAVNDLRNIVRASNNPEEARAAIQNYVAADMAGSTIDYDGNIDIPKLRQWIENRQAILNEPEFRDVTEQVNELLRGAVNNQERVNMLEIAARDQAAALKAAEGDREATIKRLNSAALRNVIDMEPRKAVASVMNAKDPAAAAREIVADLGDNEAALEGWRRAVIEGIQQRVQTTRLTADGDREISVAKLIDQTDKMRPILEETLTPEQLNTLQQVRTLLEPFQNLSAKATAGSDTAKNLLQQSREAGWATFSLAARLYAGVLKGGGITRTAKDAVGRFANDDDAVETLIARALTDPDLAAHLLRRESTAIPDSEWNDTFFKLMGVQQAQTDDGAAEDDRGTRLNITVRPDDKERTPQ